MSGLVVRIDYGTGWVDLTDYDGGGTIVKKDSLSKTNILHDEGESVIDTCSFNTNMPTTLANTLLNLDVSTQIALDIDWAGVNWFTGYARPVTEFAIRSKDGFLEKQIEWEGVDALWALKKVLTSGVSYASKKVCDPADTANSIVHLLLDDAGVDSGDIDIDVTISTVLPVFSATANDDEYFELLSDLLRDYGCSINAAADGTFYVLRWADPDVPEAAGLTTWAVSESQFRAKRNDVDQERVQIKWRKVNSYSSRVVASRDNVPEFSDPDVAFERDIHEWPPDDATEHAVDRTMDNGDEVAAFSNVTIKTFVNFIGTTHVYNSGYDKTLNRWYTGDTFTASFSNSNIDYSGTFMDLSVTPDYDDFSVSLQYTPREHITGVLYEGTAFEETLDIDVYRIKIGEYRIYADIQTIGERWTSEVGSGGRLLEIESDYIFDSDDADALAQAIYDLKTTSSKTFEVRVDEDVEVGTYRRLTNVPLNIDVVVRVKRKIDPLGSMEGGYRAFRYEVEAAVALEVLFSSVTGGTFTVQPTPSEVASGTGAANTGLTPTGQIVKAIEGRLFDDFSPDETGLFFNDEYIGFYDAETDTWLAYMRNDSGTGKFKVGNSSKYIEFDGTDMIFQGTARSSNFVSGSSGWEIQEDGDAEFKDVIIRNDSLDGLWRMRFEGSTLVVEKNVSGTWEVVNRIGGEEFQATYFVSKGVVHPSVDLDTLDIGLRAPTGSAVYDMENDYEDKDETDPWSTKTNLAFDATRYKLGSYAVKHSGGDGVLAKTAYTGLDWDDDLAVAFWFYRGEYAGTTTIQAEITDVQCIADPGHDSSFTLARLSSGHVESSIAARLRYRSYTNFQSGSWPFSSGDDIKCGAFGNGVFICAGFSGDIAKSTNGGATFTSIASPTYPDTGTIWAIDTDGTGVWVAGGNGGVICRSDDDGDTWTELTTPAIGTVDDVVTDRSGVWIIRDGATHIRSTDNGVNWSSFTPSGLGAIERPKTDRNGLWIESNGYKSTDNGDTWTSLGSVGVYTISGEVATDRNGTWILAKTSTSGYFFRSIDDGDTWTRETTGLINYISGYSIATDTYGTWFACDSEDLYKSTDNGETWTVSADAMGGFPILVVRSDENGGWIIAGGNGGDEVEYSENPVSSGAEDTTYEIQLSPDEVAAAADVATALAAALADSADWAITTPSADTVRVTNTYDGNVTDAADVDTGFTITKQQDGWHPNDSPPVLLDLDDGTTQVEVLHWYPSKLRLRVNDTLGNEIAITDDAWNMLWLYHTGAAGLTLWVDNATVVDATNLSGATAMDVTFGLDADWYDVSLDELLINTEDTLSASLINDYYTGALPWSEGIDYTKDLLFAAADGGTIHLRSPVQDEHGALVEGNQDRWLVQDNTTNRNVLYRSGWGSIDLDVGASWDDAQYATKANRAGLDFYIYLCDGAFVVSAGTPSGYDSVRRIGGFHCICADVGTNVYAYVNSVDDIALVAEAYVSHSITGTMHWLKDYSAGDVLPFSLWDLQHRPASAPEGMVYDPGNNVWVDIYLASWDGSHLVSVNGGTIADGTSTPAFHQYKFSQHFGRQKKKLSRQDEFVSLSLGSPQGVNISGSADPGTTGGHSATNSQRIVSLIGVEDATGVLWQWGREGGATNDVGSAWAGAFDGNDANVAGQHYEAPNRPLFGGAWSPGAQCGSRGSAWNNAALNLNASFGARGVAEPYGGRA